VTRQLYVWPSDNFSTEDNEKIENATNVKSVRGGVYSIGIVYNDGTIDIVYDDPQFSPGSPPSFSDVQAIALGQTHGLVLFNDGTVSGWGDNSDGQLDIPTGLSGVIAIEAGGGDWGRAHSVALKSDGTVVAWGDDYWGQSTVPTGLSDVIAISSRETHNHALRADGSYVYWGGSPQAPVVDPPDINDFVQISTGHYGHLGLRQGGMVEWWGNHAGDSDPIPWAENLTDVAQVAAGYHTAAMHQDGTITGQGQSWKWEDPPEDAHGADFLDAGYYMTIAFYDLSEPRIPSLRLIQRDDDNEFGSSRIERVQVSSAQKSGRIPGPNAYW